MGNFSSIPPACHIPTVHFWLRSLLFFLIINVLLYFLALICLRLSRLGLLRSGLRRMTPLLWDKIPSDYRMRLLWHMGGALALNWQGRDNHILL